MSGWIYCWENLEFTQRIRNPDIPITVQGYPDRIVIHDRRIKRSKKVT